MTVKEWLRIDEKVKQSIISIMNTKIQEGIDLISKMFTKRIGEVGVYAAAHLILYVVAFLPFVITSGFALFSMFSGLGGLGALSGGMSGASLAGLADLGSGSVAQIILMYVMMFVTILLIFLVAAPMLTSAAITVVTTTVDNLSENISLMVKNALGKYGRMLATLALILVVFIVVGIVIAIVMAILGLIFGWIPVLGVVITTIVMIAVWLGILYFGCPLYFAIFDAFNNTTPPMTNIMNALTKSAKYRMPLALTILVTGIAVGVVSGIIMAIFMWIPILNMILMMIISGVSVIVLLCVIYPYYKEYAGITA